MQLKRLTLSDDPVEYGVDRYYLVDEVSGAVVYRRSDEDITFAEVLTRDTFQQALARLPVSRASTEPREQGVRLVVRTVQTLRDIPGVLEL